MDSNNKFYQKITEEEANQLRSVFSRIFNNTRLEFVNGVITFVEDADEMQEVILSDKEFLHCLEKLREMIPFNEYNIEWNTLLEFKEHHQLIISLPLDYTNYPKYSILFRKISNKVSDIKNPSKRVLDEPRPFTLSIIPVSFDFIPDTEDAKLVPTRAPDIIIRKLPDEWFFVNVGHNNYKCDGFRGLIKFLEAYFQNV